MDKIRRNRMYRAVRIWHKKTIEKRNLDRSDCIESAGMRLDSFDARLKEVALNLLKLQKTSVKQSDLSHLKAELSYNRADMLFANVKDLIDSSMSQVTDNMNDLIIQSNKRFNALEQKFQSKI